MNLLPKTLQAYVDFMAKEDRPLEFPEIVTAYSNGRRHVNSFRHLKARGLIENVVPGYTGAPGEEYTGPRPAKYVLTEEGRKHAQPRGGDAAWTE